MDYSIKEAVKRLGIDIPIIVSPFSVFKINYLSERNYYYHVTGEKKIDIRKSLELLSKKYNTKTIVTDMGKILGNLLLNKGFVNEISLLVHPVIVGKNSYNMFGDINSNINLELIKNETLDDGFIWLVYNVNPH